MAMDLSWLNGQAPISRVGAPQTWVWNWRRFLETGHVLDIQSQKLLNLSAKKVQLALADDFPQLSTPLPSKLLRITSAFSFPVSSPHIAAATWWGGWPGSRQLSKSALLCCGGEFGFWRKVFFKRRLVHPRPNGFSGTSFLTGERFNSMIAFKTKQLFTAASWLHF